jgi:hypothetical protein
MNVYVVVEGKAEKIIYKSWIPLVNPALKSVDRISDVNSGSFHVVSGHGYPFYLEVIDNALSDVNHLRVFDRLVISVDSEEMTREEKLSEILEYLDGKQCIAEVKIVIQHFCLETWALGNRRVVRRQPASQRLRRYKGFFDVRIRDPELLPAYPGEDLNRAQFAAKYLSAVLNDRNDRITYSKHTPRFISHCKYFDQVRLRLRDTGHIASFESFLDAFR